MDYLAPGLLYGDPSHDGDSSPGGVLNYRARRFEIREDLMSAPLFALSFRDGRWVAVLDPAPRGDTTWTETTAPATKPIIDERIQFGALGAREVSRWRRRIWLLVSGHDTRIHGRALQYPNRSSSAAPLSSGQSWILAELPGRIPFRSERILSRRGARRVALGLANTQSASDAPGSGSRPPRTDRSSRGSRPHRR